MKEDIEQLRKLIIELRLTWLDEELTETISAGKLKPKEINEGNKKAPTGIEQVPFTESEQLNIILKALRNYFITLPTFQIEISKELTQNFKIKNVAFKEIDGSEFKKIDSNTQ